MTRAWFEEDLGDDLDGAVHAAMTEEGLDPDSYDDRKSFVDRANREACDTGHVDAQIQMWDEENAEIYPPEGNWVDGAWRWLNGGGK